MTVAQTSFFAYRDLAKSNTLSAKRQAVYDAIEANQPVCNQQLAQILGWEINRVTPRVNELRHLMKLRLHSKQIYKPTGKTVMFWEVRND